MDTGNPDYGSVVIDGSIVHEDAQRYCAETGELPEDPWSDVYWR